jgi:hypothetical protein
LFEALDARLQLAPQWRGAELERLLDADHAAIVAQVVRRLELFGWSTLVEVTYSEFGERGSIDVLGLHPQKRAALVVEVKSDLPSEEAAARKLDEKARLAPSIVRRRAGWTPSTLGVVLVLPESPRLRRRLAGSAVLAQRFPIASRRLATWLRRPEGAFAGSWFLSGITLRNRRRVKRAKSGGAKRPVDSTLRLANGDSESLQPIPTILR